MAKSRDYRTFADHQRELAQTLQDLPQLIVLEGEENYLRDNACNTLRDALRSRHTGLDEVTFHGGDGKLDLGDIIDALTGDSLFASGKIVILRNAQKDLFPQKMAATGKSTPWQTLGDCWQKLPADTWCIVEVDKINAGRNLGKVLAKARIVSCPLLNGAGDLHAWLQAQAKRHGKNLDRGAAELLQTCHGGNLSELARELEKLAIFLGDSPVITLDTVKQFMPDNEEFNIFELINALEIRNLPKAMHFARLICGQGSRDPGGKLLSGEASAHIAAGICAQRFEQLLRTRVALDGGATPPEIAERLRTPPWQGQKLCDAARRFTLTELTRILETIAGALHSAHDTGSDIALTLDKIITVICFK